MKKGTQVLSGIAILIFCQTNMLTMSLRQQFKDGKITKKEYYKQATVYKAIVIKKYIPRRKGRFKVMLPDGKRIRCYIVPTSSLNVDDLKAGSIVEIKISPTDDKLGRIYTKLRNAFS